MRGSQLSRQWSIFRLLEARRQGLTARDIASCLEADVRTVYRDLNDLHEAGFPLYPEKNGRNSYWKLLRSHDGRPAVPFTTTELMALHLSREFLKLFQGTVFHESIESLLTKVQNSLPPGTVRYLENLSSNLAVGFSPRKDYKAVNEVIRHVSEAVSQNKRIEILYEAASTGKVSARKVDPYRVWAMNGMFYLIAYCHLRKAVRTFAVDRIRSLVLKAETFIPPKQFNLEEYLQTAFRVMTGKPERVQVRFERSAAHVVRERIWHPTQEIRDQGDGSLVLTMEVPINYEVISWVLGFGAAAEVLEPLEFRQRIHEGHLAGSRVYRDKPPVRNKIPAEKEIRSRVS